MDTPRARYATRDLNTGLFFVLVGVAALLVAILTPTAPSAPFVVGNLLASMLGVAALLFGVSRIRTITRLRRRQSGGPRRDERAAAPPSATARPELWDADGLPRADPHAGQPRQVAGRDRRRWRPYV